MASIFNIGVSALSSYQRALNTTGHNVANSDTEGYSRQRTDLATRVPTLTGAGWVGSGVQITSIERVYDEFVAEQVRSAQSATSNLETVYTNAIRIDNLLADPNIGLDPAVQSYFDALQTLSDEPASIASRQLVLSEADSLVDRFHYLDQQYDQLRLETNEQIRANVEEINSLAQSLGRVNQNIVEAIGAGAGSSPNDLLDTRDRLLNDLSKLIDVSIVPQDDGAMNVFIGKGQALVISGVANTLSVTANPDEATAPDVSITNVTGTQVITSQISGGELGGQLDFRATFLNEGQNQFGLVAVGLVTSINAQHRLGLDLNGNFGADFFQPLSVTGEASLNNTGTGAVSLTFNSAAVADLTSSDYELTFNGGTSYTLTRLSDNTTTAINSALPIPTIDGLDLTITAGAAVGDTFLIQPTRNAAGAIRQAITDTNLIAAASPFIAGEVKAANGDSVNTGNASISQPSNSSITGAPLAANMVFTFSNNADGLGNPGFTIANGPAAPNDFILYDPSTADSAGKTFPDTTNPNQFVNFGGISFEIQGVPAVGDQLFVGNNVNGTSDNRNMLAMTRLQSAKTMLGGGATFQETYSRLVTDVGAKTHNAEINFEAQSGLLSVHQGTMAANSGVNLDEEAANLVKYQQAYQAAAQVISVADTVFNTLLGAIGR